MAKHEGEGSEGKEEEQRAGTEGGAATDRAHYWMRILYFWFPTCFPEETQFVMDTTQRYDASRLFVINGSRCTHHHHTKQHTHTHAERGVLTREM
jgi:hypothetical protein